jgi:hypothetical protein
MRNETQYPESSRKPQAPVQNAHQSARLTACGIALIAVLAARHLPAQAPSPANQPPAATPPAAAPTTAQSQPDKNGKPSPGTPSAPNPAAPAQAAPAPPPPDWPINDKPAAATVVWDSHGLRIDASNSSLEQILKDVSTDTGAKVEGLNADQRVFGTYGPGPARDVLSDLLDGAGYNVLMIGDQGEGTPREIVLSAPPSGPAPTGNNRSLASEEDYEPEPEPPPPPEPAPPVNQPQPQQPNPPVRTPQQLYQELQQRQQQMQQQQNENQPPNNQQ